MDVVIARVAERQHGVIALGQLLRLGLSSTAVRSRVAAGRLHRVHRGVYAVGRPSVSVKGHWMAAVLACGDGAVLSHRSALMLWGAIRPARGPVEVTAANQRRGRKGITVHGSRTLAPRDRATLDGIPCTSVARTLLDYAESARERELRRAIDELEKRRLLDGRQLDDVLARSAGRRGTARFRAVLDAWTEPPFTRSDAETALHEMIAAAGLARPAMNAWVAGYEVDAYWPAHRLVVEFDSWEHHRTRRAFEQDRIRDADLADAGIRVIRLTWRQLQRPRAAIARLGRALGAGAGAPHEAAAGRAPHEAAAGRAADDAAADRAPDDAAAGPAPDDVAAGGAPNDAAAGPAPSSGSRPSPATAARR